MRVYVLWALVSFLCIYAFRNAFVSTCSLILMSVVMQRKDFPSYLMDINGLNPWNLLLGVTVLAWLVTRVNARNWLDLPRASKWCLGAFVMVVLVSFIRAVSDQDSMRYVRGGTTGFTGDFLINRIKFVLPALLLFDTCRTRRQFKIALGVILLSVFAYGLLVVKMVPISSAFTGSEAVFMRFRHRIDRDIGLNAVDLAMLLAGGCWAMVVYTVVAANKKSHRLVLVGATLIVFLGLVLCHSRGGYIGFAATGLFIAVVRWRKMFLLLPVGVALTFYLVPSIPARLGMGLHVEDVAGESVNDWDTITAGRSTDLWPAAIEQINKSPIIGYGGEAAVRTELREMWLQTGGAPKHPHNAYLEMMLDMGIVGLVPVLVLYGSILAMTLKLFCVRDDPLAITVGGMGFAMIITLLVTALGAQSFYPTQSTILPWCSWALALRVAVDREAQRKLAAGVRARQKSMVMQDARNRRTVPTLAGL